MKIEPCSKVDQEGVAISVIHRRHHAHHPSRRNRATRPVEAQRAATDIRIRNHQVEISTILSTVTAIIMSWPRLIRRHLPRTIL